MAKFDLNDSGVVVIVGSGAGGGTLGNELAQKGIKVVILEAGPRIENQDFINDEWDSFSQLAWSDARTTSTAASRTSSCRMIDSSPSNSSRSGRTSDSSDDRASMAARSRSL